MDINTATDIRLQLLSSGWHPIRNRDKRTFMANWPREEVTPDVIAYWARKFKRDLATGLLVKDGLAVVDFDIDDAAIMEAIFNAVLDAVPTLDNADVPLLRRRGSGAKEAWFLRTEEAFSRMFSRGWTKPGENADEHDVHRVEIFGGGSARQFGAFGPHTVTDDGEVLKSYGWVDQSPLDVAPSQLPLLAKDTYHLIVDTVERTLAANGWQPVPLSSRGEQDVERVYDLKPDMMFDTNTGERLTLAELYERALAHDGLRCSASWLEGPSARNTTRCLVTTDHEDRLCIWESASGVTHMEPESAPKPRPDHTEGLAKLGKLAEAAGIKADPVPVATPRTPKVDPRVLYKVGPKDTALPAATKLLKLYAFSPNHPRVQVLPIYADSPEDGMTTQAMRSLYAPNNDEDIGPRGGRVVISPADIWLNSRERITVAGIRMRPDRDWPIYEEDGQLWINCFKMPEHEAEPVGLDVFLRFMEHLLPDRMEREWFLDCAAHKYRFPWIPGPGVIMVSPKQGAGRGTLFSMFSQLFGRYAVKVDGSSISGDGGQSQYNRFLAKAVVIMVDELFNAGTGAHLWQRKKVYDRLKGLIDPASRKMEIIQKTLNNFEAMVYAWFLMATNNANALPLEEDDRRVGVLLNGKPLEKAPHVAAALDAYRDGRSGWQPGFISAVARFFEQRDLSGFNAFEAPHMFAGKRVMIDRNLTDVSEAADEAIEELPGDFVTRNDFVQRVRMKMGDNAREHKNLVHEARERLDRKWHFIGRERISEKGSKADVWGRTEELVAFKWRGSPHTERQALLEPCSDPRRKATAAQMAALARGMSIIDGGREDGTA